MFGSINVNSNRNRDAFVLKAIAASDEVSHILKANPNGHVHSVFSTSFNLAFGGHLVHVGALGNGIAPFGIGLEQTGAHLLTTLLAVDLEVVWDKESMSVLFPKGISLSLNEAKWTNHTVQSSTYDLTSLEDNFKFLANRLLQDDWNTGLAETSDEKKRIIHYIVDPSSSIEGIAVLDKLNDLKNLVWHHELDEKKVFDYWIGRGLGLTPSGDDVITGICAVLSALEGTDQTFLRKLKPYLIEYGQKRTTYVALEYLLYATDNKFHSHLQQLCYVLDKPRGTEFLKAVEEMKEIGHTSGADTVLGMLLGMKAAVIHKKER
ncbi:DUF2877 domain-containing protein [Sporosarcina luteola]|uniref:DUF2877 domain-containing protein n=1 Tax=Sporosarcina luteola TaxID=582850 RepID=UPI002041541B|nr:DUF2877 domain-containing protein [Sporosarcina luteola]MCM3711414.1 DUF2877 domain-containing protein [Sporosarcina luteola]